MSSNPEFLWWNGERRPWADATIHVTELGWSTIGAVFEGIRAYWNDEQGELYVFRLQEHLERLARSMKLVRLPLDYALETLTAAIIELLRENGVREDTYIRPLAYTSNSATRRYDRPGFEAELLINTTAMPSHLQNGMTQHAKISSWRRISEDVMPPRVKNLSNYRNGQLARLEAQYDGYDTAILLSTTGKVSEAPGACVMLVRDGVLVTPDLQSSILESITRDALLVLAREELGLKVEERQVDRTELYLADEVFLCGTHAEVSSIVSVDKYDVGDGGIGPVTRDLELAFNNVLRGKEHRFDRWRTPVGVGSEAALSRR